MDEKESTTGSGATESLWMATAGLPSRAPLQGDAVADVCVIGAGIAGLSTAYLLSREGRAVVVIDDGAIGGGETSRTTAHWVNALDDRYFDLERLHGPTGARRAAESHSAAMDRAEAIAAEEGIECGIERLDGYLFVPPGDDPEVLEREAEAARRAGLDVALVDRAPVDSFDTGRALRFPRQLQLHPLRYLAGLADAIERRGGRIHTGTRAVEIADGAPATVETAAGGTIEAGAVVVATNSPFLDRFAIHTKQAAYRTYVVALEIAPEAAPRVLLWDTPDPYHYVRAHREGDRAFLVVGGEDHKTGQAEDPARRFGVLEAWARERFPAAGAVAHRWSGQVLEPNDGLGFLGRNPGDENLYVITGDSGNGMTHGTVGAIVVTDLIAGRESPWSALYDPSRKTIGAVGAFLRENANVAAMYADWLTPGEVDAVAAIAPGSGAVLRDGLSKIAVYRDEDGALHARSAVCTHLACIVDWNDLEKSWDCPCHGSRYDAFGRVTNGPAVADLPPAALPGDA